MITSNKLERFYERVDGDRRPITADIFLTDYCNNKCVYCRYAHTTGGYIRFDDFVRYAERLIGLGVRGIVLTGGGEPTINPDFDMICHWLEERNIDYGVNTNLNRMVDINPVFLKVSIDSGDREEYKKVRGRDCLDKVLENLRKLVSMKSEYGRKTSIGVQCVAVSRQQVRSFYDVVNGIGVDYIQFRPIEMSGKNIDYSDVLDEIGMIDDDRVKPSFKYSLLDFMPERCFGNWSVITVNVKGDVIYCCHKPGEIVGSIFDENILEKLEAHRTDMSSCEIPCRLSGPNKFLCGYVTENDSNFI